MAQYYLLVKLMGKTSRFTLPKLLKSNEDKKIVVSPNYIASEFITIFSKMYNFILQNQGKWPIT